jgi:biopolymer transport protein TolR
MAMQMRGSGRRQPFGRMKRQPMSDINVTPMVDVMLVLLVIFMVTAPLLTVGVPVDLPKANANPISGQDEPLVVTVNAQGDIYIQDSAVQIGDLGARLEAITHSKPDTRIFVRGDKGISYGRIMEVMSTINQAGFTKVALVAEAPSALPSGGTATPSAPAKKGTP